MKNILGLLLIISIMIGGFTSCEEPGITYEGPELVAFTPSAPQGDYYVMENGDKGYEVEIGFTTSSNTERTVNFTLSGTAEEGVHFKQMSSHSITVPAGSYVGTLKIDGLYSGFTGEKVDLIITLTGDKVADFKNSYTVSMQQYCPFDIASFEGHWNVHDVSAYNGESDYVINLIVEDADAKTMRVQGLWENTPEVIITFDDTDPGNFIARIEDQFYANHSTYGEMRITDLSVGSFSSCDQIVKTSYKIYVDAGNFDKVTSSVWTKQ